MNFKIARVMLALLMIACASSSPRCRAASEESKPAGKALKVLFIGNSLTSQNNLAAMLKHIAREAQPSVTIDAEAIAIGGAKLEKHWGKGDAQKKIAQGGWDYVVLQDHSSAPIKDKESMQQHMKLFDAEIRKAGAKTLLYLTWALQKSPEDQAIITQTYQELGKELNARVIPVGIARHNAAKADPAVALFVKDGKHPTPGGTYLAACVFFQALTGQSPKGLTGKVPDQKNASKSLVNLNPTEAAFFQKIAEETASTQLPATK